MGRRKEKGKGKPKNRNVASTAALHREAGSVCKTIQSHPEVDEETVSLRALENGGFEVTFMLNVTLPSRAKRKGRSRTGMIYCIRKVTA